VHAVIIIGFVADYGFEYSDEEVEEEDVDIENQYYNSKGTDLGRLQLYVVRLLDPSRFGSVHCAGLLEGNDQTDALKGFQEVVKMEPDKAEW